MRHSQIHRDQVWSKLTEGPKCFSRVGDAADVGVAGSPQRALQQEHILRLIVDDQDPASLYNLFLHMRLTSHRWRFHWPAWSLPADSGACERQAAWSGSRALLLPAVD